MLTGLPIELLELVFQHCTHASLKELRLVDKFVNKACTPFVFELVHLGVFSRSINNLLSLSRSSLAKHVRTIDYHFDRLPDWEYSDWLRHIDWRPPFRRWRNELYGDDDNPLPREAEVEAEREYDKLPRHNFARDKIESAWPAYRKLVDEQTNFSASVEGLVFKECLSSLPNLREVIALKARDSHGWFDDSPFWKNVKRDILVAPQGWDHLRRRNGLAEADTLEGIFVVVFLEALGYRNEFYGMKPVERLSLHLTTRDSPTDLMGRDPDIARNTEARFQGVLNAIGELKYLIISAPYFPIYVDDRGSRVRDMYRLLGHVKNLRSLRLGYSESATGWDILGTREESGDLEGVNALERHALTPFLSNAETFYPCLHEFELVANVTGKALADFLLRHQSTLRRLILRNSIGDDWELVWKTVSRSLKLDYVHLEDLYQHELGDPREEPRPVAYFMEGTDVESELNTAMKAYLLRGDGGELPQVYYDKADPWYFAGF